MTTNLCVIHFFIYIIGTIIHFLVSKPSPAVNVLHLYCFMISEDMIINMSICVLFVEIFNNCKWQCTVNTIYALLTNEKKSSYVMLNATVSVDPR